ncbi:MAG: YidC/Oxa1 family membrane protein insertase [Acidimicrobiales bacterium]|jgi:YidC/Oxa1 family membrane protein insertase|nr:YidC/Oxa1 family membrane protein insertase [Acidimicrobiales bacterium]
MFDVIAAVLAWFYGLVPSFGLSIILLTFVVMVVVTPLTLKGTRSMIKMQHLQPEMKKIQTRYKGDRDAMNKEMMAFYQANGINPMGGCLPLFVQAPVFMVLYQVLRGMTRRLSDVGADIGWVAGRLGAAESLSGVPANQQAFYPAYVDPGSELFADLTAETEMLFLGFDLSRSAGAALSQGILAAFPYLILILVVFASAWIQQRQIRGRNPDATVNPQQQMLMKVMPFFLPVISFNLDAALVLYFVISNLYRIAQQAYITRTLYGPGGDSELVVVLPEKSTNSEKGSAGGKASGKASKSAVKPPKASPSSSVARKGRTMAGANRNDSQNSEDSSPVGGGSAGSPGFGRKPKGPKPDAKKKKAGRRSRGKAAGEPTKIDKRPPGARAGGGRTTPPGTAGAHGAKKKRRK